MFFDFFKISVLMPFFIVPFQVDDAQFKLFFVVVHCLVVHCLVARRDELMQMGLFTT